MPALSKINAGSFPSNASNSGTGSIVDSIADFIWQNYHNNHASTVVVAATTAANYDEIEDDYSESSNDDDDGDSYITNA